VSDKQLDVDVAVVGAGIVGAWISYQLARDGRTVALADPHPGSGASTGNAGMLVPSYCIPMSNPSVLRSGIRALIQSHGAVSLARPLRPATLGWMTQFAWQSRPGRARRDSAVLCAMAQRSTALYNEFTEAEGLDIGLRRTGWLHTVRSDKLLAQESKVAEHLDGLGVRSKVLTRDETHRLEAGLGDDVCGGVLFPDDSALDPAATTAAVLSAAAGHGAHLVTAEVAGTQTDSRGRVTVRTHTGQQIRARTVVLAAGALTPALAKRCGVAAPRIEPGFGWTIVLPTERALAATSLVSAEDHVVINASATSIRITGGMRFGGSARTASATAADFADLRAAAERLLPAISSIDDPGHTWSGARPMTASGLPNVRCVDDHHIVAAGHGTLGMTLAPATAEAVAREVDNTSLRSHT
jgi:D-amino-acid dehydrogenase